jgi:hypothetical protein
MGLPVTCPLVTMRPVGQLCELAAGLGLAYFLVGLPEGSAGSGGKLLGLARQDFRHHLRDRLLSPHDASLPFRSSYARRSLESLSRARRRVRCLRVRARTPAGKHGPRGSLWPAPRPEIRRGSRRGAPREGVREARHARLRRLWLPGVGRKCTAKLASFTASPFPKGMAQKVQIPYTLERGAATSRGLVRRRSPPIRALSDLIT